jgi:SAM-dependent methyltransferase
VKREAPAAARNREPILAVLRDWLPADGTVLEIAAGTGEHALHFAAAFPRLAWQPTDPDPEARASIDAWRQEEGTPNLVPALHLDVMAADWPLCEAAAVIAINLVHISPPEASTGLLEGAARLLAPGAPLILYGPWRVRGEPLAPSNLAFDAALKERDPRFGLRDLTAFAAEARDAGFTLAERRAMPANNLMLRFVRLGS